MKISTVLAFLPLVFAAPASHEKRANPVVVAPLPQATVTGTNLLNVESFKGIPYAQPPVNQLRLKPPQPLTSPLGKVDGTGIPKACPQFFFSIDQANIPTNVLGTILNLPLFQTVTNAGEDCLTINVQRPAGTKADAKLPVLFWIFGGGFELGSTAMYDGTSLVAESVAQGKPIIFVAVNYRVGGFGFMPGKEVLADGSANLGLLDQRLGLQWVADNIAAFGGDPSKVTIWGESAGAISVMDQMMLYDGDNTYKGKPLFRAGIMNSGSVVPADPVDCPKGQAIYDRVVEAAGCSGASDTLVCLRTVPYTKFLNAANTVPGLLSYFTVNLSYLPRPDGKILTASPDALAKAGKFAKVPFIVGNQEDEGTLFGLFTANLTTTSEVNSYLSTVFFNNASPAQVSTLVNSYQTVTEDGSPFRTGIFNSWYPQFKRISAILGDVTFTLTRRIFLNVATQAHPDVPSWSYLATYNYGTPILGTFHASDILQVFFGVLPNNAARTIRGYYFSFVYNMDPNVGSGLMNWPKWSEGKKLVNFGANSNSYLDDDFRSDTYDFLSNNVASLRV
ncbi:PnbA Carboxylesterase type B [Pyrenophora tritici-repentis]|uniref:Carboxylic ester hydrolase n=2 Tax=Pyrenophora tritici-repentis TaxID=45151 RepID=A0A2W1HT25_9PLEO|nr:lipase 3 precursor [Pyrenophora tritici-repentis Pt-1C-BFP]KAA8621598.1 PnbA Carboxylesterase type B [Pyrenophora tritici-repentis]EDU43055.1 lipase 3 precursor [Pyrenophora tritici-repentis Pt-1C-BFP]KAF7450830.1 PnbA Carboxylesterase type B [Pyrenophora tritici-repentis]KAF7573483.1 PnbA, Carboxylesterase type B [Pyrenophora tritici-repentis]KAG9380956.1 PnbA Carboxylesterase type B [Pyrenophora tritici-repentis]